MTTTTAQPQTQKPVTTGTGSTALDPAMFPTSIDVNTLKTPTGKMLTDFEVPASLIDTDAQLVDLIMRSESMKDSERQYWFNLTEVMNTEQVDKLRGILVRERKKLAEIESKYGKKPAKQKLSPEEAKKRNAEMARKKAEKQAALAAKEQAHEAQEAKQEEALLDEFEDAWS